VSSFAEEVKVIARDPPASSSAPSQSDAAAQASSRPAVSGFVDIRASADRVPQFLGKAKKVVEERDRTSFVLTHSFLVIILLLLTLLIINYL
jgi:hypothetical protein